MNHLRKLLHARGITVVAIIFFIIALSIFFLFEKMNNEEWMGWRKYRNTDLGFSFLYPERFGDVVAEEGENMKTSDTQLKGEYFAVGFQENDMPFYLSASTPDWEAWEIPVENWQMSQSAEEYCTNFSLFIVVREPCVTLPNGVVTVNYASHMQPGPGSDSSISYSRAGFIRLQDKKFAGLIGSIFLRSSDDQFTEEPFDRVGVIATQNLPVILKEEGAKINEFDKILSSFIIEK